MQMLFNMMKEYNHKVYSAKYPKVSYITSELLKKLKNEYPNSIISDAICFFIGWRHYILIEDEVESLVDYIIDSYKDMSKEYKGIVGKPDRSVAKDIMGNIIEQFYRDFFWDVLNLKYDKKAETDFYDEVYEAMKEIGNYKKHLLGKSKFENKAIDIYYDPITKEYSLVETKKLHSVN